MGGVYKNEKPNTCFKHKPLSDSDRAFYTQKLRDMISRKPPEGKLIDMDSFSFRWAYFKVRINRKICNFLGLKP